jgi:enterochelin esterase-like enzyme
MRFPTLPGAFLVVSALTCPAAAADPPGGTFIETMIHAPSIERNVFSEPAEEPIAVYLPPSYDSATKRYPVVYFLPGFGDIVRYYTLYGVYQGFSLKSSMDRLIGEGRVKEMIVVIPNGVNFLGGSFYVNSPVTGNWEDFIVHDVVGFVDDNYRTLASPASRGLAGHSMGGYGALSIGMHHPEVFGAIYAMSPGLFDENGLSRHFMVADTTTIDSFLATERQFGGMSREASAAAFFAWMSHRNLLQNDLTASFAYAYGAAFAPDTARNAPCVDYPFRTSGDGFTVNAEGWRKYESGFGGLEEKVLRYRDNLLKLKVLVVEFGNSDEHAFIPDGCRRFSALLTAAGVPHRLDPYEGAHSDKVRERLEGYVLPVMSERLDFD